MASLKDTVVSGSLRATDTIYSTTNQFQILHIPTSSNGTTYGPGTSGQVLKSNGTSVYWASDNNTDSHVAQGAAITTAGAFPILLANSTSTNAVTATVNKTSTLTYNPNTKSLVTGGTVDGYTLAAASAKGVTDNTTNTDVTSSDTNLITGRTLYYQLAKKGYTTNTGTVTSVQVQATSPVTSSTSTAQTGTLNTTIALANNYGDTKNPYASKTKNTVLAAGATEDSAPSFRALVAADIPNLSASKITSDTFDAARIPTLSITDKTSGTLTVDRGGTGATSATGARNNLGLGNAQIFYGTCSTAASTTAKVVTCTEFSTSDLKAGAAILVTFTATNTGAVGSLTMNVNSTGAKAMKKQYNTSTGNLTSAGELIAGNTYLFVYNATYSSNAGAWVLITADYNNTYDMSQLFSCSGTTNTELETSANGGLGYHRYCLLMMTPNQKWSAISAVSDSTAADQGTSSAKVASTANFLIDSSILYPTTNIYAAPGGTCAFAAYSAIGFNLRYSIGTTATNVMLSSQKPIYLVGIPNADGATFKLDSTQWWTQDLPTSNDGKIYIYLGLAYSTSNIYLNAYHPVFCHNGTNVVPYISGGVMRGELTVNAAASFVSTSTSAANYIYFKNTAIATAPSNIVMQIGLGSNNQNHGIYSQGYYDGTSFTAAGGWLIARNAEGKATVGGRIGDPMGVELRGDTYVFGNLYHYYNNTAYNIYDTSNIIYKTTTPDTRNDGTALQTGDIWLKPI